MPFFTTSLAEADKGDSGLIYFPGEPRKGMVTFIFSGYRTLREWQFVFSSRQMRVWERELVFTSQ